MSARRRQDRAPPTRAQSIYRIARRARRFTQIPNALLRDEALSPEERGVLAFLLTFPDDWVFQAAWVREHNPNPRTGRPMGERRWNRIVARIVSAGYCRRHQPRVGDGTFGPYVYEFYEEPNRTAETAGRLPQDGDGRSEKAVGRIPIERNTEDGPPKVPPTGGHRPPATYLPTPWSLPDADRAWARQHAPALADRIDAEAEAFADWHHSRRARRADWSKAWHVHWRQACERAQRRPTPGAQPVQGKARNPAGHVDGVRIHDRSQAHEKPRWYERGTPEFTAYRSRLQRSGDDADILRIDRAGGVRLSAATLIELMGASEVDA